MPSFSSKTGLLWSRLAVVAGGEGEPVTALLERAAELNSERVLLVGPGAEEEALGTLGLAAAVAGAIAGEADPAVPLGGTVLKGLSTVSQNYTEEAVDSLIRGGVTVAEYSGGEVSLVRAVTTRTATGGNPDRT